MNVGNRGPRAVGAAFPGHTQQIWVVSGSEPVQPAGPGKGTRTGVLKEAMEIKWVPKRTSQSTGSFLRGEGTDPKLAS